MSGNNYTSMAYEVAGTGAEKKEFVFFHPEGKGSDSDQAANEGYGQHNGRVRYIHCTVGGAGTITAGTIYLVHRSQRDVTVGALERKHKVAEITPSGWSGVNVDTPLTAEPHFKDSLVLVADITGATGAWTLDGEISIEVA